MSRIKGRIELLTEGLAAEAVTPIAPTDRGGAVLAGLKVLRQLRLKALDNELKRLEQRIEEKATGGGDKSEL